MSLRDPLEEDEMEKAVSVIEILLVIAIVAIIGASVAPFLSRFVLANSLETTKDELISTLRKAQENSLNDKASDVWGVCFISNNIRLYRGSCVAPIFSEDFAKPAAVSINGLQDTVFSSLRGEPDDPMSITLSTNIDSLVVEMNSAGGIEVH
jgi:type II secretory pathway pseudopilin PulG